jgi:hypothetical protein
MQTKHFALEYGPLWRWETATLTHVTSPQFVASTLNYHDPFPLREVAASRVTIPSLEHFEFDELCNFWGPSYNHSLVTSLPTVAKDLLRNSFVAHSSLSLPLKYVINLPGEKKVVFVLDLAIGEDSQIASTLDSLQHVAQKSHTEFEQAGNAWQFANRILKKWNRAERIAGFVGFLDLYPTSAEGPNHPVNKIRCDLEDAVLSSGQTRHALQCPEPRPPVIRDFLESMPVGFVVEQDEPPNATVFSNLTTRWPDVRPPRDGHYSAIRVGVPGTQASWIVVWHPHHGEPPFSVLKAATCAFFPAILRLPPYETVSPPTRLITDDAAPLANTATPSISEINPPWGIDKDDRLRISDLTPTSRDLDDLIGESEVVTRDVRAMGTEALAWHQGFHTHSRPTCGIFFNAPKIDGFVKGVYAAVIQATSGHWPNYGYTAMAVVQWIAEHEWFHARIEAALTQLELTSGVPRCAPYKASVYRPLVRVSDDCLEEALANYTAQECLMNGRNTWAALLTEKHREALTKTLAAEMTLSPPGYRAWERGRDVDAWRSLAWELMTGRAAALAESPIPPVEQILLGPLPYDHQKRDIAWYIYDEGVVMNALFASPTMLSVPARRELTTALRYLGYQCDESRGKGSHEMWFKGDGTGFPLPRRDPVGRKVFGTFLAHTGLATKANYITHVRPHL